ncbi:cellulase family glycosylhydrolase [Janibacter sp. Y6]|uniref:cellulase family glycosylhydrolase n=1 Tax=Janibacter sp. Y6 TaxID=2913552 RepID=UPI0034A51378
MTQPPAPAHLLRRTAGLVAAVAAAGLVVTATTAAPPAEASSSTAAGSKPTPAPTSTSKPKTTAKPKATSTPKPTAKPKPTSTPKPTATPSPAVISAPAAGTTNPRPALGVQYHGMWSDQTPATRAKVLDQLAANGSEWVRIDVSWAMIEPKHQQYDMQWGVPFVDTVLKEVEDRGLKAMVTFWLTPDWASYGKGERYAPRYPTAYGRAAGWAAKRWGRTVDAWEMWNEQNHPDFFTTADPVAYTKMLCSAYKEVKKADTSPVVYGGLQYNDAAFVKKTYTAGAKGCFDILATHPYSAPSDFSPSRDGGAPWGVTRVRDVRAVMVAQGDAAKPIWFTELGWSTGQIPDPQPWQRAVSEATQADFLEETVALTRSSYPYVKGIIWFRERDRTGGNPYEDGYGLMRADLTPKPALARLKAVASS